MELELKNDKLEVKNQKKDIQIKNLSMATSELKIKMDYLERKKSRLRQDDLNDLEFSESDLESVGSSGKQHDFVTPEMLTDDLLAM